MSSFMMFFNPEGMVQFPHCQSLWLIINMEKILSFVDISNQHVQKYMLQKSYFDY